MDAPYSSVVAKVDLVPDIEEKWFARYESTGIFCALASAMFCGESVNRQLKAKNITTATINMLAREMIFEHLSSVYCLPKSCSYSSRLETTNEETIGEKLKENTMMEIPSHTVTRMPSLPVNEISLRLT
ncbi:hypothetical protein D3C75_806040 [compost metagenome]